MIVENYFVTAEGTPGRVVENEDDLGEVMEYEEQHPDKIMLNFHTHSEGTRKLKHGETFMYDFSERDEKDIIAKYPEEIAMLITPEVVKARKGNTSININIS